MAEFPTSPVPIFPVKIAQRWNTIIADFDGATEQARQKQAFAKYDITLLYNVLSKTEVGYLWNFYQARAGRYGDFYFYTLPETEAWEDLYVGVGDGVAEVFDLPGKTTSSVKIYVDGVLQTVTTDYVLLTGGGTESADRVDFVSPPAAGEVITCDFTGYMRIHCRFKDDSLSRDLFSVALYSTGLELKGLFP